MKKTNHIKRILVTAAGGSLATGFIRSLRQVPEKFYIVGTDADKYNIQRSEADKNYLIPKPSNPKFLAVLKNIIKKESIQFLHVQISGEVLTISKLREELLELGVRTFLPKHETIEKCENKMTTNQIWQAAGIKVPQAMMINNLKDLKKAFIKLGPKVWLREIRGSAGRGSFPTDDLETGKKWIDFRKGWGIFQAAECLEEQTIVWQSIWSSGKLVVAQGRKRLYWEFANRAPSGVTGITGTGITVSDKMLDQIGQKAILAVDSQPSGVFGVDMTFDKDGIPNPTEINSARFMTTHQFFTAAGLNMPYILVKLAFGEKPPLIKRKLNPLPNNLAWVRGMDVLPKLTTVREIEKSEVYLNKMLAKLS